MSLVLWTKTFTAIQNWWTELNVASATTGAFGMFLLQQLGNALLTVWKARRASYAQKT
jgi:hypothetical protein